MIKQIIGKKIVETNLNLDELNKFKALIIDLGCGDGKHTYNLAKKNINNFYIGIDANSENLEEISFKASRKPAKGGVSNLIFIQSPAEELSEDLNGIADAIEINFPWGTLLEGIVNGEERILGNIKRLLNNELRESPKDSKGESNKGMRILLSYDSKFEDNFIKNRELPNLTQSENRRILVSKLEKLGFQNTEFRLLTEEEKSELDSTWAKKILSERDRDVWEIRLEIDNEIDVNSQNNKALKKDENIKLKQNRLQVTGNNKLNKSWNLEPDTSNFDKIYTFYCFGHPNIRAEHFKTLEFTKDTELTERGDCIIGIKATFEKEELKKFRKKVKFICSVVDPKTDTEISSEFKCTVNPEYSSNHELVLRKKYFQSDRTFGFNLNRGANHLDRNIVKLMQDPKTKMKVVVKSSWK